MNTELKRVMVVGGGIAGLTAAWELSLQDIEVILVEKGRFLGGHAIQFCCKATDECLQCGACSVESMLKNVVNESKIKVLLGTEVEKVEQSGKMNVILRQSPVDLDMVSKPYAEDPQEGAANRGYSVNNMVLFEKLKEAPNSVGDGPLTIDAMIVATGFSPFDPTRKPTYGYGQVENVVTGMDIERSKRVNGKIIRPSDGQVPEKVAFIQCVGSRDERLGNLWCSQVCCPYALRTAEALKYQNPESEITVFYMDIQNTNKNFTAFYEKCREDLRFIRSIPVDIYPMPGDKLRTRYLGDDGQPVEDIFDLVVLSVGIMPGDENTQVAEQYGLALNPDGFFEGETALNRTSTGKQGVFLAGTAHGPKTIASSMAHAGQTAAQVIQYLGGAK